MRPDETDRANETSKTGVEEILEAIREFQGDQTLTEKEAELFDRIRREMEVAKVKAKRLPNRDKK